MENKMEKRYSFGGFAFGSNGLFQLTIATISPANYGTTHSLELGLELTAEEIQELITVLLTRNVKEDN
jgi:subtilisin-like proprotein convertase family protein